MSIETLREALPDYAKDLKLNLGALAGETLLSEQQKWGCFLAAAYAVGAPDLVRAFEAEAETRLTREARSAAKAAAAVMGMNNVYYRALHLMQNDEYRTLRAGLRMNVIANPGVDKTDFELWSLAASAINGCGACLDAHEKELRMRGLANTQIQAALRIAAVVHGAGAVLRAHAA
ncbi:MAG TPA: carboxymuconolactone decarboxylase family protein [Caulobacterales bacterium]|nr:carboxymuconolactone decarboxylase family protein [Caulobacterales bacterium]